MKRNPMPVLKRIKTLFSTLFPPPIPGYEKCDHCGLLLENESLLIEHLKQHIRSTAFNLPKENELRSIRSALEKLPGTTKVELIPVLKCVTHLERQNFVELYKKEENIREQFPHLNLEFTVKKQNNRNNKGWLTCPKEDIQKYRDYMDKNNIPYEEENISDYEHWFIIDQKHDPHSWEIEK